MMITIYRIDPNGYYIEGNDATMYPGDEPPADYVTEQPPAEFQHPRYVDGAWIDAEPAPKPPTDAERIEALEQAVAELKSRLDALEPLTP